MPSKSPSGQLEKALASGRFVMTAEVTPPVSSAADDLLDKALPPDWRTRLMLRMEQGRAPTWARCSGRDPSAQRDRADAPVDLPRPKPSRTAERPARCGGARHPQDAGVARRRSEAGRPAGRQTGVRPRFRRPARDGGLHPRRGELPPAARSPARPIFSSAPPTCRSIRRRTGSQGLQGEDRAGAQFAQTQFCMDIEIVKRNTARLTKDRMTENI